MISAFLNFEEAYIRKSENFYLLDPSEKGAINYFLGMVFSNLIATSRLDVVWLIHLDSYDKNLIAFTKNNRKKPDFIGITKDDDRIVLESKGWTNKNNNGISKALQQLHAVLSVEGDPNILKVASIFYEKGDNLHLEVIDPKEKGLIQVFANHSDYLRDYYARIFLLLKDSREMKKLGNCDFITNQLNCNLIEVGLLKEVFDIIYQNRNNNEYITENIKDAIFKKVRDLKQIDKENNISVGLDGTYLKILE